VKGRVIVKAEPLTAARQRIPVLTAASSCGVAGSFRHDGDGYLDWSLPADVQAYGSVEAGNQGDPPKSAGTSMSLMIPGSGTASSTTRSA
jgi:hypothetical protein